MSKLLQEAIADAKAVRATALANAELALKETFSPKLQSMISRKLQAEMDSEDEEDEFEGDVDGDGDIDAEDFEAAEEDDEEEASDDITAEFDGDDSEEDYDDEEVEDEDVPVDELDDEEFGDEEGGEEEEFEDEEDDELDLESIIAELEAELSENDEEEEEFFGDDEEGGEEEEVDDVPVDEEAEVEDEEEEEFDLDEILRALDEIDLDEEAEEVTEEEGNDKARIAELEAELEETRDAVVFMRDKINEVNLLNAKLLYANKLFRAFNLDNPQKMRVIESIDRTKNTREVKLVYATLAESLKMKPKKASKATKKITESFSSKQVGSTAPKGEIINEATDTFRNRMKQLANIK